MKKNILLLMLTALSFNAYSMQKTINIDNGDNVWVRQLNSRLLLAVRYGEKDDVLKAIKEGANVNAKDEKNNTPLHLAADTGVKEIVEILLENGANIYAENKDKEIPLHMACMDYNKEGTVRLLLEKDPLTVHAKSEFLWTPLNIAASYGLKNIIKLLISRNANVNTQQWDGKTPLHFAADKADQETVELLLDNGANKNIKNNKGQTAANITANNDIWQIINNYNLINLAKR